MSIVEENQIDLLILTRCATECVIQSYQTSFSMSWPQIKIICFSPDGDLMALCNQTGIQVFKVDNLNQEYASIERTGIVEMELSPKNSFITYWEPVKSKDNTVPNLQIYDLKNRKVVFETIHKKQHDCMPQWSKDEFVCVRNSNSELLFYEGGNFEVVKYRLIIAKISNFSLSQATSSYIVAVSVPGSKGQPSFVRIYKYPHFNGITSAIANKSFYKAERVELYWNSLGTACLILTFSEVSTDSYYGEQQLHYVGVKEESCLVPRAKNGPIYHIQWNPNGLEFCVVYGYMPAKATLYNLKCEPTFDFGTSPRNSVYYNPQGNLLVLAGFGSLQGNIEVWELAKQRLVAKFQQIDVTYLEWLPDGAHFVTGTLTPRLRVGNGFRVWNIYGQNIYKKLIDCLYDVQCRPMSLALFEVPKVKISSQTLTQITKPTSVASYVPPALRNLPPEGRASMPKYREEYEPPSNLKQLNLEKGPPSKNTEKNRKKRENKKAKKLAEGLSSEQD